MSSEAAVLTTEPIQAQPDPVVVRFDAVSKVYDRRPRSVRWRAAAPFLQEEPQGTASGAGRR